jgi:anaerobic ribonucleoside-triphosphate reductase activating protein
MLNIYNFIESTKTLGPFNRFALWTQGCSFSCTGCMTQDSQSLDGGVKISVEGMAQTILNTPNIEGITISGGEPFLQAEALYSLLSLVGEKRDFGVIVYTGFSLEQLKDKNDSVINLLLEHIDILIDGLFYESLNDGISLRGSSNQNIYQLTNRYENVFDDYYDKDVREIEMHMQSDHMMLVGIPKNDTLHKMNTIY